MTELQQWWQNKGDLNSTVSGYITKRPLQLGEKLLKAEQFHIISNVAMKYTSGHGEWCCYDTLS